MGTLAITYIVTALACLISVWMGWQAMKNLDKGFIQFSMAGIVLWVGGWMALIATTVIHLILLIIYSIGYLAL